ncbi:MAG: GNAT family N-acetyltransferase [Oscillospiraceae bacterium]|nr:GNAT family N-acetyltransferase [Oscillospiraceae bacterium]
MNIRHYRKDDVPAMRALWQRVFNERDAYLDAFFALMPDIGGAAVAEDESGRLCGAAYALTGYELLAGGESPHLGYIYAVAVDESARGKGIGAALTQYAAAICREREAVIVTTLPAEESLYAWYEKSIGTKHVLRRAEKLVPARRSIDIMKLTGTEYMLWRENMLRGKAHVHLSHPMLEAQRALCEAYDGGLYASSDGIFAAYRDGEQLIVPEILCAQGIPDDTAASAAAHLGCREAVFFTPAERGGEAYVASDTVLPPTTVWNLTLD